MFFGFFWSVENNWVIQLCKYVTCDSKMFTCLFLVNLTVFCCPQIIEFPLGTVLGRGHFFVALFVISASQGLGVSPVHFCLMNLNAQNL